MCFDYYFILSLLQIIILYVHLFTNNVKIPKRDDPQAVAVLAIAAINPHVFTCKFKEN